MNVAGVSELLKNYPSLVIDPASNKDELLITGEVRFNCKFKDLPKIEDSYFVKIIIPEGFPKEIPEVYETMDKIERSLDYHIFKRDNGEYSLCLGTRTRLLRFLSENPSIYSFVDLILIPWLYSVSYKRETGNNFPIGELRHGYEGVLDDYADLFKVKTKEKVIEILGILSIKKSAANKKKCPYGCKFRLGLCPHRKNLNEYRALRTEHGYKYDLEKINKLKTDVKEIL